MHPYRAAWSFRIGRVFGIDIRLHWVFLAFLALLCLDEIRLTRSLQHGAFFLFQVLLLFGFVLLHELGHSLTAQRAGLRVIDIVLWPLGGIARLKGQIRSPAWELKIAAAGPAVNLALAAAALPFCRFEPGEAVTKTLPGFVLTVNLLLGGFNLVPAFPMDGGRILRALAARKMSFEKATERAVQVGRIIAWSFLIPALAGAVLPGSLMPGLPGLLGGVLDFAWGNLWLGLICLFLLWAGRSELLAVRAAERMRSMRSFSGDEILDAQVVGAKTADGPEAGGQADPSSAGSPAPLEDYERQFIDLVNRYRKRPEDF